MSLKQKQRVKKLVLVSASFMPVTAAREEAIKNIGTVKTNENGEYLRINLIQIPCI